LYKYAQIDETGRCVGVSYLSGEVIADHMIPLADDEDVLPGDLRNEDGTWTRPDPPAPQPDRIAQLEAELLQTKLALAELAEANEADKTDVQLALAELADLIAGGE